MSNFLPAPKGYRKKILHQSENVEISLLEKVQFKWWWLIVLLLAFCTLIFFDVLNVEVLNSDGVQIFTTD
jgi:hypothetical protein